MKIKTVEQLAKEYRKTTPNKMYGDELGFIAGYNATIEKVKEYLFNTEEHQDKNGKFYISEDYLKQIIKFLNEQ